MKYKILLVIIFLFGLKANAQNEGDSIFYSDQVHEIYIMFNQISYWDSLVTYFPADQYLQADITFDGTLIPSVGVKFKGN